MLKSKAKRKKKMFWYLLMVIPLSVAAAMWASKRGRSAPIWFFISALLSPILGFIFLAVMDDLSIDQRKRFHDSLMPSSDNSSENATLSAVRKTNLSGNSRISSNGLSPEPSDQLFADALAECDSPNRQLGLWAKSFAEAQGDDRRAKAIYTKRRAEAMNMEVLSKSEVKTGLCPNCYQLVRPDEENCPRCKADLTKSKPLNT